MLDVMLVCVLALVVILLNGKKMRLFGSFEMNFLGGIKMSANTEAYSKLFGAICDSAVVMARCACVACNSCTCACSCRNIPEWEDTEIEW